MTASIVSSLTTATVDWPSTFDVVNGTRVPPTAVTTILQCNMCSNTEQQQQEQHEAANNCLLDTAVQQTAGGGSGDGHCSSVSLVAAAVTATASPSPQEKLWGASLLMQEGSLTTEASIGEEESGATLSPTAATAAMWGNLAILSGAMTVAVGAILWQ